MSDLIIRMREGAAAARGERRGFRATSQRILNSLPDRPTRIGGVGQSAERLNTAQSDDKGADGMTPDGKKSILADEETPAGVIDRRTLVTRGAALGAGVGA